MRNVYFRFLSAAQKCHLLRLLISNNGNGNDVTLTMAMIIRKTTNKKIREKDKNNYTFSGKVS